MSNGDPLNILTPNKSADPLGILEKKNSIQGGTGQPLEPLSEPGNGSQGQFSQEQINDTVNNQLPLSTRLGKAIYESVRNVFQRYPEDIEGTKAMVNSMSLKNLQNNLNTLMTAQAAKSDPEAARELQSKFSGPMLQSYMNMSEEDVVEAKGELDKRIKHKSDAIEESLSYILERQANADPTTHTQRLSEIDNPIEFLEYVAGSAGEGLAQIPASIVTMGLSSFVQEAGSIYTDQIQQIQQEKSKELGRDVSVSEIIEKGWDDPAMAGMYGTVAAALDRLGAGSAMSGVIKKVIGKQVKNKALTFAKGVGTEALTEGTQTGLEQIGAMRDLDWVEIGEAAAKGAFASGPISAVSTAMADTNKQEDVTEQGITQPTTTEPVQDSKQEGDNSVPLQEPGKTDEVPDTDTPSDAVRELTDDEVDAEMDTFIKSLIEEERKNNPSLPELSKKTVNDIRENTNKRGRELIDKINDYYKGAAGNIVADFIPNEISEREQNKENYVGFLNDFTEEEVGELKSILNEQGQKTDETTGVGDQETVSQSGTQEVEGTTEQGEVVEKSTDLGTDSTAVEKNVNDVTPPTNLSEATAKTDKQKTHDYVTRNLADERLNKAFKDDLEKNGTYTQSSIEKARTASNNAINATLKEYDNKQEGLNELASQIKDKNIEMEDEIRMISAAKVSFKMLSEGMNKEAADLRLWVAKEASSSAKKLRSIRSDSSPEETISRVLAGLETKKQETLEKSLGKDYESVISGLQKSVSEQNKRIAELEEKVKNSKRPNISNKKQRSKQLIDEGINELTSIFEKKFTKRAVDDNPASDPDVFNAITKIFNGLLLQAEYNVEKALNGLKSKLKGKITPEQLEAKVDYLLERSDASKQDVLDYIKQQKKSVISKEISSVLKTKKGSIDKLISADLENLTEDDVSDLIAESFGVKIVSKEQQDKLIEMVNKISEAPEGEQQLEASEDFLKEVKKIEGVKAGEILMSMWYSQILSGPSTHALNFWANMAEFTGEYFVSSVQNVFNKNIPVADRVKGLSFLTTSALRGFKRGWLDFRRTLSTGYSPAKLRSKFDLPNSLEFTKIGIVHKYVPRFLKAIDTFFFRGIQEMRSAQLAMNEAFKQGKNKPTKEIWAEVTETLYNTKERITEAEKQAQEEGLTKGSKKFRRRIYEILEQNRPEHIVEDSNDFASYGTFNYQPEGTLGEVQKVIQQLTEKIPPIKFIIPFSRVLTNVANKYVEWSPIGFLRVAKGGIGMNIGQSKMRQYTGDQRQRVMIKAVTGTMVGTILYVLSQPGDDDEPPIIEITAEGTPDYKKNYELAQGGFEPYSVKIGDTWLSYKNTDLAIPLATIGFIRDMEKYGNAKKNESLVSAALMSSFNYFTDLTALQSVSELLDYIKTDAVGGPEGKVRKLGTFGKKLGKSMLVPNAFTQFSRTIQQITDSPIKQSNNFYEDIVRDMPVLRDNNANIYTALGEPVVPDVMKRFYPLSVQPNKKSGSKAWDLIIKNQAWVGQPNKNTIHYIPSEKVERKLTDAEYNEYSVKAGRKLRKYLEENYNSINSLDKEQAKSVIDGFKKAARTEALYEVID